MNKNSWIIIIDERCAGGMLDAARRIGGEVTAAVVGSRALADTMASLGFDRVLCFETREDIPAEAYGAQLAEAAKGTAPGLVLASDASVARMLLGAVAAKLNAALIGSVRALTGDDERMIVSRSTAEGRVLEDIEVRGNLAVIFDGEDVEVSSVQPVAVEEMPVADSSTSLRLIETIETEDSAGLLTAARVVGVGMGLKSKDDLKLIEELTEVMHAETACTLPVCNDMRWLPSNSVVGSSHNQIAPDLYIGIGISGQPHHVSGIRDAKVVVAINKDPEAKIFKNCNYGIVGDLYEIVPALTSAFKNLECTVG